MEVNNAIGIGENANPTVSYEFVVRVRVIPLADPVELATVMSPEEYQAVAGVVKRLKVKAAPVPDVVPEKGKPAVVK
jgi:hypothetical protein